jgi:hypothetical protein
MKLTNYSQSERNEHSVMLSMLTIKAVSARAADSAMSTEVHICSRAWMWMYWVGVAYKFKMKMPNPACRGLVWMLAGSREASK